MGGGGESRSGKKKEEEAVMAMALSMQELDECGDGCGGRMEGWVDGKALLSALVEETNPPSLSLVGRSLTLFILTLFEAITLSPGQAHHVFTPVTATTQTSRHSDRDCKREKLK